MLNEQKNAVWSDEDYDKLGWNMSRLYGFRLPGRNHRMIFDLDYILESPLNKTPHGIYKIAPATLEFFNVVDLKIQMDQGKFGETSFVSLERSNLRLTPNGKMNYWDYRIELSPDALIEFTSTGFRQTLLEGPTISEFPDLDREEK